VVGLGREAAQLAGDVRQGREHPQLGAPRVDESGPDSRLAEVVEDEAHFRTLPRERNHPGQLPVEDAHIEAEAEAGQQPHAADEVGA